MIQCGCIEIVEKITVNADRSGRAEFAIDLGMLGSLATKTAGNYLDLSFMDQMKSFPATYESKIKNTAGINNTKAISDDKNGLYSIAFDFKNPAALPLSHDEQEHAQQSPQHYNQPDQYTANEYP
jgi:hypothetical protein